MSWVLVLKESLKPSNLGNATLLNTFYDTQMRQIKATRNLMNQNRKMLENPALATNISPKEMENLLDKWESDLNELEWPSSGTYRWKGDYWVGDYIINKYRRYRQLIGLMFERAGIDARQVLEIEEVDEIEFHNIKQKNWEVSEYRGQAKVEKIFEELGWERHEKEEFGRSGYDGWKIVNRPLRQNDYPMCIVAPLKKSKFKKIVEGETLASPRREKTIPQAPDEKDNPKQFARWWKQFGSKMEGKDIWRKKIVDTTKKPKRESKRLEWVESENKVISPKISDWLFIYHDGWFIKDRDYKKTTSAAAQGNVELCVYPLFTTYLTLQDTTDSTVTSLRRYGEWPQPDLEILSNINHTYFTKLCLNTNIPSTQERLPRADYYVNLAYLANSAEEILDGAGNIEAGWEIEGNRMGIIEDNIFLWRNHYNQSLSLDNFNLHEGSAMFDAIVRDMQRPFGDSRNPTFKTKGIYKIYGEWYNWDGESLKRTEVSA